MADAGEAAESRLVQRGALEEADVVKIGHHGSEFGTTSGFLASVHPKLAVISVGRNRYGHPSPGTLDRIRSAGAAIHVTRQGGALMLRTNGDTIFWQPFVKPIRSIFDGLYR